MPGSGEVKFGANKQGEHGWIEMPPFEKLIPQQTEAHTVCFCRTHVGREADVAHTMVGVDVDGLYYVSTHADKRLKTVATYGTGSRSLSFHNPRDYLLFMHAMLQAGKRAGFIHNDVDVFMTPREEISHDD